LPTLELRTKRTLGAPLSGVLQEYIRKFLRKMPFQCLPI